MFVFYWEFLLFWKFFWLIVRSRISKPLDFLIMGKNFETIIFDQLSVWLLVFLIISNNLTNIWLK